MTKSIIISFKAEKKTDYNDENNLGICLSHR